MKRWAPAIALSLLLAGCASMTPPAGTGPQTPSVSETAATRPYADKVNLGGRLSVRYQNNGKDEAMHGSFVWTQDSARTSVTLLSPLGQTLAIINFTPDGATLTQGGQPVREAANVDSLVASALGWPLPISGMREWLQGFAVDATGNRFIATAQATDVATRDGWHIRYASWQDESQPAGQNRPKRIDLVRHTAQAGDVSIRIVIDTWQTH